MGGNIVLPGQSIMARGYGRDTVVYSAAFGWKGVVDGAEPRNGTRLFVIQPGKAQNVPAEVFRFIEDHHPFSDVVRVDQAETDEGIKYDIAGAKRASLAKGEAADLDAFKRFVSDAVEDFVKRNKPVPQPPENIMKIIERRGFDLKKFGIVPIGWADPEKERTIALETENKSLRDQFSAMQQQFSALQQQLAAKAK